jgi:hypothetical protein
MIIWLRSAVITCCYAPVTYYTWSYHSWRREVWACISYYTHVVLLSGRIVPMPYHVVHMSSCHIMSSMCHHDIFVHMSPWHYAIQAQTSLLQEWYDHVSVFHMWVKCKAIFLKKKLEGHKLAKMTLFNTSKAFK